MLRSLPSLILLALLPLAIQDTASGQWPTDAQLDRLPPPQIPATVPETTRVPQGTGSTAPGELLPPEEIVSPDEPDTWIMPTYWFHVVDWEGGAEIGISGTDGNSQATSFRAGTKLKRKTEVDEWTFDVTYLKASANGIESQHNAIQNYRYERSFGDTRWSWFAKEYLEYDEFKAFDLRLALNGGVGHKFIDTDVTKLKGRFGAGVSHEIGGPSDEWVPELVYGADFERKLTERQKLSLTVDYFPEFGAFHNYRMVSDFGWEVLLDEAHNLNLKLSVNDRYDSTPNGRKPNDINYALLLLWKL